MEHLTHFGLPRDPFRNEPQRRFYFESRAHRDAERRLLRGIRQGKGLEVLTGPVGSGKTTLVRHLLDQLDEARFEAGLLVLIQGAVHTDWLLRRIAQQIGVDEPAAARAEVLGQIFQRLVEIRRQGRRAVLLIDEAQMLERREILTEVRGLLNLEFDEQRLLTLVLTGLPELEEALRLDPPLADRVEIRVELSRLDAQSASEYLGYRIRRAGGRPEIFEPEARLLVARLAEGVPRRMNTLADNALFEAYLAERNSVTRADVERAAAELGWIKLSLPGSAPAPAAPAAPARGERASVSQPGEPPASHFALSLGSVSRESWIGDANPEDSYDSAREAPAGRRSPAEDDTREVEDEPFTPEIALTDPVSDADRAARELDEVTPELGSAFDAEAESFEPRAGAASRGEGSAAEAGDTGSFTASEPESAQPRPDTATQGAAPAADAPANTTQPEPPEKDPDEEDFEDLFGRLIGQH